MTEDSAPAPAPEATLSNLISNKSFGDKWEDRCKVYLSTKDNEVRSALSALLGFVEGHGLSEQYEMEQEGLVPKAGKDKQV